MSREKHGKIRNNFICLQLLAVVLSGFVICHGVSAASISSFSPTSGRPGNVITIRGSGFTTTTNVAFNNATPTLADFVINSDSQLIVVVPIGATTGPLEVGTSSSGSATSTASFSVAPAIVSFSPQTAANPGQVSITGANFVPGNTTVTFTGVSTPVTGTVIGTTLVNATVPVGAANGPITVTTPAGSGTSASNLIASSSPTITSFSPSVGTNGTLVTIFGGNLYSGTTVKFGNASASSTIVSTTEIDATVPTGAATAPITVTTSDGSFETSTNFITSTGPIITDFSPTFGTTLPPTPTAVEIDGYNLAGVTSVTFNGGKEELASHGGSTSLQVNLTNATGTGPIEVLSPTGNFTTSSNFSVSAAPLVTSFNPALGGSGLSIAIYGLNFTGATSVKFNGASASFTASSSTEIHATVPSGATTGPITVASNSSSYTTTSNFVVTTGAPDIVSFSPASGVQGTVVTINGGEFTNISAIEFNGVSATYQPPNSTTVLYATVPSGATTGPISVRNSNGTQTSSTLFYLQPWITNFTASNTVNAALVIQGRNLTNTTSVTVSGVNYPAFTNSPNQIVAAIPSNAVAGTITVTTPGGVYISPGSFIVLPNIYSFSPTIGPAGTVVTIDGTSLSNVTSVLFNGVSATPYNVTANQLQVAVPSGATPGLITVITPNGRNVSSNIFTATYSSTVNLTKSVSPRIVGPGTNVTYTLFVTNLGPSIVTSVTVTDNLPNGFTYVSSSSTMGTTSYGNNMVVANIGFLTNNTSATITVRGTSTSPAALTNTANLGFAEGETIYGNNYAFAYTYFLSAAQRTLSIALPNTGEFAVTWPVSAVNFALQVNTNLLNTNGWLSLSNIFTNSGLVEYTNTPTNSAQYFRLLAP